jgi:hypothetical protein
MYTVLWLRSFLTWLRFFLTVTEVFPCFFLSCKANAKVKLAKTGHGPHSSTLVVTCVVLCICVNVYCHRVTTQLQLINISYHISYILYHIIYNIVSYHTYLIVPYRIIYHIIYHIYHITSYHISYHHINYTIIKISIFFNDTPWSSMTLQLHVFFMLFYVFFCVVLCDVCFVKFPVLFVCICVLNNCHRVATQLQLNISYVSSCSGHLEECG